jgi:hypothetical protein
LTLETFAMKLDLLWYYYFNMRGPMDLHGTHHITHY